MASTLLAAAALTATAAAAPAFACACGTLAPPPGLAAAVTDESAIITHRDGVETIVLSLDVESGTATSGLIVPTPTAATVSAADPAIFDSIESQTVPSERVVDDWWGNKVNPGAGDSAPTVVSRLDVGGLEATTLAATDTGGLTGWLSQNGFEVPADAAGQLQQYIDQRWQFVALKLSATSALNGTLAPIQISFPSDSIVYPLSMARAAATEQSLRLSVFADNRVDLVRNGSADQPLDAAVRTVWAGPVTEPALTPLGAYLTVIDLRIDSPQTQISSDIGVVQAPNNDVVDPAAIVIRPIELLGFPLGTLLAVWGGLGLLGLLAVTIARSRLR